MTITGNDQPRQHCYKEDRCYENLEGKGHWINELINYEAVNRTAPATPGLLKMSTVVRQLRDDLSPESL